MSRYGNLSPEERATIESKLIELHNQTGKTWAYSIMDKRELEIPPLLEIIVDGRISQPVALPSTEKFPAEVICGKLDSYAEKRR